MGFSYCLLLKLHVEWKYAKMECFTTYFLDVSLKINLLILLYKYYSILYATLKNNYRETCMLAEGIWSTTLPVSWEVELTENLDGEDSSLYR